MKESKKKTKLFSGRSLFVLLAVITSLTVITVVMNLIVFSDQSAQEPDAETLRRAAIQAAQTAQNYDDGLTYVYTEDSVPASSSALPIAESDLPSEDPAADSHADDTLLCLPVQGEITKDFSAEDLQYSDTMDDWRIHDGIDFLAEDGCNVCAASSGVVESTTEDGLFGVSVLLSHSDGTKTFYGNLQEGSVPSVGTQVSAGDYIGKVGQTATLEITEPPHLHFEVISGEERLNPHDFFGDMLSENR